MATRHARSGHCKIVNTYRTPEWEPLKRIDEQRYGQGQPNLFDADLTAARVSTLLGATGQDVTSLLP